MGVKAVRELIERLKKNIPDKEGLRKEAIEAIEKDYVDVEEFAAVLRYFFCDQYLLEFNYLLEEIGKCLDEDDGES